ncbi:MAG TPA: TetR/AcrR family transcriptional regulator [Stellaceae bacterium]|nr:TetR/AcrR family transcriptional regulator [Stellaceae bacterium]
MDLFAANGFDGVSIADIAGAAGVSQGALYRHYPSKEELAWALFSTAYLRTGEELDRIRSGTVEFEAAVMAMTAHFCALYDDDPALFRFMLITQHGFLPRIPSGSRTPVDAVADLVSDAVAKNRLKPIDPALGAAVIMGIILQSATFHIYGRLGGSLGARAPGLARAAIAAVAAFTQ